MYHECICCACMLTFRLASKFFPRKAMVDAYRTNAFNPISKLSNWNTTQSHINLSLYIRLCNQMSSVSATGPAGPISYCLPKRSLLYATHSSVGVQSLILPRSLIIIVNSKAWPYLSYIWFFNKSWESNVVARAPLPDACRDRIW